jgi:hypothetical protein
LKPVRFLWIILIPLFTAAAQSVNVPLEHRAYGFLERMETRGVLPELRDGSLPFTRERIAGLLLAIERRTAVRPDLLSGVERKILDRLKGEFWDELADSTAVLDREKEPHLYSWKGKGGIFHADAEAGFDLLFRTADAPAADRRVIRPRYGAAFRGRLWDVGFFSDNRIFAEWGSGIYNQRYRPSQGYPRNAEKDSSRATWDVSDSYVTFSVRGFQFEAGRDNLRWGRSPSGGLLLSGLAPSMDLVKLSFAFGSAEFTWFHGQLRSDFRSKWISAHRIECTPAAGVDIAVQDAVVYGNRGVEPAYFNPVLPFLVSQHSLGDRDNVVMGLDASVTRIRNLKITAELFIDDLFAPWHLFSGYWGNKAAFQTGVFWTDPAGLPNSGLRCEYTRIEPFVYTHKDSVNTFEHFNSGLGSDLSPNSDRWSLAWEQWMALSWRAGAEGSITRHGEGDRRTAHTLADGDRKRFLCGVVETIRRIGVHGEWEPSRDLIFRCDAGRVWSRNWSRISGSNLSWNEFRLRASWNW